MALTTKSAALSANPRSDAATVYSPLGQNQTRFLVLFPAESGQEEICGVLKHVFLDSSGDGNDGENTLDDVSEYEALSYTWDSPDFTETIWIGNSQLKVTANLYQALLHLRRGTTARIIWIDAICINQQDTTERNHQVLLMKEIYSRVNRVLIWLGKDAEDARSISRILSGQISRIMYGRSDRLQEVDFEALTRGIFQRPWWSRSWAMQEFILAERTLFIYGSMELDWDKITALLEIYDDACHHLKGQQQAHFYTFIRSKNTARILPLSVVMYNLGHCQATDPRDKVYAFLAIASDGHGIMPNYAFAVDQVYMDLVRTYFNTYGTLEIICMHHRGRAFLKLPSWVPDWSISRSMSYNWMTNWHGNKLFSADGFSRGRLTDSEIQLGSRLGKEIVFGDLQTLITYGTTLGEIATMASCIDPESLETDDWIQGLLQWNSEDIHHGKYRNGEPNFRAFCRTLIADTLNPRITRKSFKFVLKKNLPTVERFVDMLFNGSLPPELPRRLRKFFPSFRRALYRSRFATTSNGYMALVPDASEVGDEICILAGCSTPMVMRKGVKPHSSGKDLNISASEESQVTHQMIGPSYVHGVMDGEMSGDLCTKFVIV